MRPAPLLVCLLAAAACRGTIPERNAAPSQASAALLIGCKMILPSGETRSGELSINFDAVGESGAKAYRLPLKAGETYLYAIEPGVYRLKPTRSPLGLSRADMTVLINGRTYHLPFPRDIRRRHAYDIRPGHIVSMGIVEVAVMPAPPEQAPMIHVRFDDAVPVRRALVQSVIHDMMDPLRPIEVRDNLVAWSQALQNSLLDLLSKEAPSPAVTPSR